MRISFAVAAVVGIASFATPALSADMPVKAPMMAPVVAPTWTGFYLGLNAGWGFMHNDATAVTGTAVFPAGFVFAPSSVNGAVGGVQGGYNYQWGNIVLGVEGEFDWADINHNACALSTGGTGGATSAGCLKVRWTGDVSGRLGYAFDRWMIFGKVGGAWTSFRGNSQTFSGAGALTNINSGGETRSGLLLGVGAEYAYSRNWSVKVEYNYIDFGTDNVTRNSTTVATGVTIPLLRSYDTHLQLVKVGFNYRF